MISYIEQKSLNAWPALNTIVYDGWLLRFADGLTRRANAIYPLFNSTIELEEKLKFCENIYFSKGQPVIFKLTEDKIDINEFLINNGYQKDAETYVQTISTDNFSSFKNDAIRISDTYDINWINRFLQFNNYNEQDRNGYERILNQIFLKTGYVDLVINGECIGCGLGVIEESYVGIFDIVVSPMFRNRGYGQIIVESLIKWGNDNGAKTAYLQVMKNNPQALRLYEKIGFKKMYKYWYQVKQPITASNK